MNLRCTLCATHGILSRTLLSSLSGQFATLLVTRGHDVRGRRCATQFPRPGLRFRVGHVEGAAAAISHCGGVTGVTAARCDLRLFYFDWKERTFYEGARGAGKGGRTAWRKEKRWCTKRILSSGHQKKKRSWWRCFWRGLMQHYSPLSFNSKIKKELLETVASLHC